MKRAHFRFLTGDINWQDYGGSFYRRVSPGVYHVMRVMNWVDAVGQREAAEVGYTYNVDLSEIDLRTMTDTQRAEVAQSCGFTPDEVDEMPHAKLVWVDMCHGYGLRAPLWDENGNNLRKLMAECRAESLALDDEDAHEAAMNRPVNGIGSTAREFGQGDITSALGRAIASGSVEGDVLAKMHRISDDVVSALREDKRTALTVRFHMDQIPSNDPLAFQAGYMRALMGERMDKGASADAYIEGYKMGVDVKSGRVPRPDFHI